MNSRTLCIATLVGCFGFSFSGAGAAELADVDLSNIPLNKPTLDYLHENNVQIPQTEYDDEGNLIESSSILAPESAYTLTEVPAGADGAAPVGDNIITKFNYNSETGEFTPVYYQVNLKQTEYGDPNGDVTLTFGWQKTEDGYGNEYNEFVQDPTTPIGPTITYKYNSSETTTPDSGSYNAEYINQVQSVTLENPDGTSSSHYQHIGGVSGITNFENVLFKDNNTNVDITIAEDGPYTYVDILGGALNNSGNIDTLSGDFINNSINSTINKGYVSAYGGAIYNTGNITNINANFNNNSASGRYSYGGAVYNSGEISEITGNFINNTATGTSWYGYGGAIYNSGKINNINANFIGNYASSGGGAIYNDDSATIGNITGNFINNNSNAISNSGIIGDITGDFINNSNAGAGGAIYNKGSIGDITGNFIGNQGRAIHNYRNASIGNITGDFIGNNLNGHYGGAIYNNAGSIGDITGNFIGNIAESSGAAICNSDGTIGNITGDFIGNSVVEFGGIIQIYDGTIGNITGDFIGNNGIAISNSDGTIGDITGDFIQNSDSAISNAYGTIGDISGDFIGNGYTNNRYAIENNINNSGTIGDIAGNFINNKGAIYNDYFGTGVIGNITGDFIGNNTNTSGGAIYNSGDIGNITGNFINNFAENESDNITGGAISHTINAFDDFTAIDYIHRLGDITGDFIGNYAKTLTGSAYGGAIYTTGTSSTRQPIFLGNITGNFVNNYAAGDIAKGGAIYNGVDIHQIKGDFINNSVQGVNGAQGAAIYNSEYYNAYSGHQYRGEIANLIGNFISNSAITENGSARGGAIYNAGTISEIVNSSFIDNYAQATNGEALGGAIYSTTDLNIIAKDGGQSVFSGNYTESKDVQTPNAIYLGGVSGVQPEVITSINTQTVTTDRIQETRVPDLTLNAVSNGTILFDDAIDGDLNSTVTTTFTGDLVASRYSGYYSESIEEFLEEIKNDPPYWADDNWENLSDEEILARAFDHGYLEITNEQSIAESTNNTGYSLNITGDETGKVILNNDVTAHTYDDDGNVTAQAPVNISLENTNLYLGARDDIFDGNNLDLKSGFMSMVNDSAGISALNNLTVSGDVNFAADVDLANQEMDRFTAADYGEHTGNINVIGMNLLSDAPEGRDTTEIFFAETGLMDNVVNGTGELPDSNYQVALTPIYKYNVGYETREDDGGYFIFTRGDKIPTTPGGGNGGGSTGNPSDAFNPAVLATPVGNLAAGQAAMNEAFKYVFEHADAFTQLPAMERYAKINANKYALSTDFNDNMPSYADQLHNNAVWFRPYTTFETMNIKNGPKVDAITYGSLVGFDGDFKEMKNGWSRIFTGYAGYMGSSLNYSGVDTTMNGGLLGFTETFYKGNFWTAITASAGASVGESHTMYGKEDYTSLLAGVGSKTGYNFEFKDGKFIIQPIMFLSYTFVNTFDYKNAAGVSIESDPLHTIQLNPSVRFIANLKGGWQPYASVGMVWNLMNESKVTANNVKLPEMSVKPYVEYGVGVQRNWADKFTAFLQAMIRNGGRNGVALTGGFRFMLGSDSKNSDKPKVKKEIKSL